MGILDKIKKNKVAKDQKDEVKSDSKLSQKTTDSTAKADDKSASDQKSKKVRQKSSYGNAYKVLVKPIITEKTTRESVLGKYTFEVYPDVNKIQIRKAINDVYGVEPKFVNIINSKGKKVRLGMVRGSRKNTKKAVVTLKKGDSLKIEEV